MAKKSNSLTLEVQHSMATKFIHISNLDTIELRKFCLAAISRLSSRKTAISNNSLVQLTTKALICGHLDALSLSYSLRLPYSQENTTMIRYIKSWNSVDYRPSRWLLTHSTEIDSSSGIRPAVGIRPKLMLSSWWLMVSRICGMKFLTSIILLTILVSFLNSGTSKSFEFRMLPFYRVKECRLTT